MEWQFEIQKAADIWVLQAALRKDQPLEGPRAHGGVGEDQSEWDPSALSSSSSLWLSDLPP